MPHKNRYFQCKHPGCNNSVRYNPKGSGYCHLHYDTTEHGKRIANYNRTIKKVVPGMRATELGLRTENVAYVISVCDLCRQPYLATPASLKRSDKHFCSPECKGVYAAKNTPNKDTSIERAIEAAIKERGWEYKKQVPLAGVCVTDFFLPALNVAVFCDGDFWHSTEKSKARAKRQHEVLTRNGYIVHRFSETEIKKSAHACLDKINLDTKPLYRQLDLPTA